MMLAMMAAVGKNVGYRNSNISTLKALVISHLKRYSAAKYQMLAMLAIGRSLKYSLSWKITNHNLPLYTPQKPDIFIIIKENPGLSASWIGLKSINKKKFISQHCQQLSKHTISVWLKGIYRYISCAYISANTYLHVPTKEESCLFSL
ncbi:MAG: hypothetical protein H7A37_09125 [Chlamydiales bacterium]|nr:hypothetical protein [Chlamydiales bacterium]